MRRLAMLWMLAAVLTACSEKAAEPPPPPSAADQEAAYEERLAEEHAADEPVATPASAGDFDDEVLSEWVEYGDWQGESLHGYLAYPAAAHGAMPGIIVFHEWWGLNDNIRAMSDKLAAQGYVVLAVDMFGGEIAETPERARELTQLAMSDSAAVTGNITAAYKFMHEETQAVSLATLGWCLGGGLSLRASQLLGERVAATVIYYGHVGGASRDSLASLKAPLLGIFGEDDSTISAQDVENFDSNLQALGVLHEIHRYPGAQHAFANPSGTRYNAAAASDAWEKTLRFLDENLHSGLPQLDAPISDN